ncbi:glycosyltransferase family 2 protein, partial [Cellulomonas triticagri]
MGERSASAGAGEATPLDVTVVIAARDAARTLPHQLRALAAQRTRCRWEVLVADNGSTDGTARVVERARAWLPRVRVLDAAAVRGAGAARNAAAEVARGDALLFCDADDVVDPGWVDAMRGALRRSDLVAGRLEWERLNDAAALASRALPQDDGLQSSEPLPALPCASASNLAIRRDRFRRLGGFDTGARYLQDTDLCWRAQLDGAHLAFEPAAVVHMRLRANLRGAWRQGRGSGMGQRWLAARYGRVAASLADGAPGGAPAA